MTKKEALAKALIWRLAIAVPVSLIINYIFIGSISTSINLTVVGNLVGTILYYLYDIMWFKLRPQDPPRSLAGMSPLSND